ncbi:histone deacetylase [Streptomyces sp. NPDC003691]
MSGTPPRPRPVRPDPRPAATGARPDPDRPATGTRPGLVWYASYGSNTDPARLRAYLEGGRPAGAARSTPGCRDPRPPRRTLPLELPGTLHFATRSPVWSGGRAFWDPDAGGTTWARAYLVTLGQFSDIAAQEMYRTPGRGPDLDPAGALADGREELGRVRKVASSARRAGPAASGACNRKAEGFPRTGRTREIPTTQRVCVPGVAGQAGLCGHGPGPGRYETLVCPGYVAGLPVLTFTAPWHCGEVPAVSPSAACLRRLAAGLLGAGPWRAPEIARYLAAAPGAEDWTPERVAELLEPEGGTG